MSTVPRELDDSRQVFDSALAHELVEATDGVLLEVRCGAVRIERLAVFVLLVNKDGIRVVFDPVGNEGDAAGSWRDAMASFSRISEICWRSSSAKRMRTV